MKNNFAKLLITVTAILAPALPAYAARFHSEIYRARSVYVTCDKSVYDECAKSTSKAIQWIFSKRNRWTLASEPAKADLVLVWFQTKRSSTTGGKVTITKTWRFGSLIVLKGGSTPDWNAVPLYVTGGKDAALAIQDFYDEVIQTAPPL